MNATSQTYRDDTNLPEILSREKKNNDLVDDAENLSGPCKELDNHQIVTQLL